MVPGQKLPEWAERPEEPKKETKKEL